MRGVWQHRKLSYPGRPHLTYVRECLHWNEYVSRRYLDKMAPLKVKVDVKCQGCGDRVRFNPYRSVYVAGRGRPRQVRYLERPPKMPRYALMREAEARNKYEKKKEIVEDEN